jgi:hypothetical protein
MNALLRARLMRRAAVPHAYLRASDVKAKSITDTVTPLAMFLTIRRWHVAGCLKELQG